jgi:putative ATP-dependent endonuclease of OLD family
MIERSARPGPVLAIVEGSHDIQFLRRISRLLHGQDEHLPDLGTLETEGRLVFIPTGGELQAWADRLAALPQPQFFLIDREAPPASIAREVLVRTLNQQPGRVAYLTSKRASENYLHPSAVLETTGMVVEFDDASDVPDLLASKVVALTGTPARATLSRRGRTRLRNRLKKVLNTIVVEAMTMARVAERDPDGEVAGWLRAIASMIDSAEVCRKHS